MKNIFLRGGAIVIILHSNYLVKNKFVYNSGDT
jgi:hypothetical protein